jgi:hypothetical protein
MDSKDIFSVKKDKVEPFKISDPINKISIPDTKTIESEIEKLSRPVMPGMNNPGHMTKNNSLPNIINITNKNEEIDFDSCNVKLKNPLNEARPLSRKRSAFQFLENKETTVTPSISQTPVLKKDPFSDILKDKPKKDPLADILSSKPKLDPLADIIKPKTKDSLADIIKPKTKDALADIIKPKAKEPLADIITSKDSKPSEFESRRRKPFGAVESFGAGQPSDGLFKHNYNNNFSTPKAQNVGIGIGSFLNNPESSISSSNINIGGSRRHINKNLY